jgi:hypothetical protein
MLLAIVIALQAVVVTYDGWYAAIYFAEEDEDPTRNLPRSSIGGVLRYLPAGERRSASRSSDAPTGNVTNSCCGRGQIDHRRPGEGRHSSYIDASSKQYDQCVADDFSANPLPYGAGWPDAAADDVYQQGGYPDCTAVALYGDDGAVCFKNAGAGAFAALLDVGGPMDKSGCSCCLGRLPLLSVVADPKDAFLLW